MKKKFSEISTMVISLLIFMIFLTMILNFIFHDLQISALGSMMLCGSGFYLNQKAVKQDKKDFEQQCDLQYNAILSYIMACMQQPSWAPNITIPTNIMSICTLYYPAFKTRSFTTTLKMVPTNRAPLPSPQLTQVRQILNTDLQMAMQNGLIQCKDIKVNFPINNNNEVHISIEVFL